MQLDQGAIWLPTLGEEQHPSPPAYLLTSRMTPAQLPESQFVPTPPFSVGSRGARPPGEVSSQRPAASATQGTRASWPLSWCTPFLSQTSWCTPHLSQTSSTDRPAATICRGFCTAASLLLLTKPVRVECKLSRNKRQLAGARRAG